MKRRFTLLAIATFLSTTLMAAWDGSTTAEPSGSGTEASPYLIATEANLAWVAANSSSWSKYFQQTADLDLGSYSWTPIGNNSTKFTGTYDGNGYLIDNLYYNDPSADYAGLFGYVSGGTLINITIGSGYVYGNGAASGLCGYAVGSTISYCANNATVYAKQEQNGGICGYAENSTISDCINYGLISGFNFTGGVVGRCKKDNVTIKNCVNVGQVFGMRVTCGNLVGFNDGFAAKITKCYYDNQINSSIGVTSSKTAIETNNDLPGSFEGKATSAIVGTGLQSALGTTNWYFESGMYPRLRINYNKSAIVLAATPVTLASGEQADAVATNFTVSTANSVSWTSENTSNLTISGSSATILKSTGIIITGTKDGYTKNIFLKTNKSGATAIGSSTSPLTIESEDDLKNLRTAVNTYGSYKGCAAYDGFKGIHFKVTVDIALTDWTEPIGIHNSFKGIFDGNNRSISNINTDQMSDGIPIVGGLFGCASYGEIKNITLTSGVVSGTTFVGGICGSTFCETLTNCTSYCNVNIDNNKYAGGIVGVDKGYSELIDCQNYGKISSADCIGGIMGASNMSSIFSGCINYGTITCSTQKAAGICGSVADNCQLKNCENHGNVTATNNASVGGIFGITSTISSLSIVNCINSGTILGKQHVGGIGGQIIGTATIENCVNIGSITSSSNNAGGIAGLTKTGVSISNSFNAGKILASTDNGGIVGSSTSNDAVIFCLNISNIPSGKAITPGSATITNCYYDSQMCPIGSTGKLTSDMIGTSLQSDLGTTNWTFTEGIYPMITTLKESDYMIAAATPLTLNSTEKVSSVSKTFAYGTSNSVEWTCDEPEIVSFSNGTGYISNPDSDTPVEVVVSKGDANKKIAMTIKTKGALTKPDISWTLPKSTIAFGTVMTASMQNATETNGYAGKFHYSFNVGDILHAGTHTLTATFVPDDDETYATKTATAILTVSKGEPVITWSPETTITYGDEDSDTKLKNAIATDANGDAIDGKFYYTIPALTVGPKDISVEFIGTNYSTSTPIEKTITVVAATPTIAWAEPAAIDYGTALSTLQLSAVSGIAGTFAYSENGSTIDAGDILNAGTHTLTATFTPSSGNYQSGTTKEVTLVVNKVTPTITWDTPSNIVYGTELSATQLSATADQTGAITYAENSSAITIGNVLDAGSHIVTATFTPTDAANYNPATKDVTITVTKATPEITWATPADITYGTALSATQLNATSAAGSNFSYTLTNGNNAMGAILNAGDNVLTATLPASTNYIEQTKTVTIHVNKADPIITWTPQDITYGATLADIENNIKTATAAFNSEDLSNNGNFLYDIPPLNAGIQSITVTFSPSSDNFNTVYNTKTINVAKATPAITWSNPDDIVYGTELSAAQLNATADVVGSFTSSPVAGTKLNAGDNQTLTVNFAPTDADNYNSASAEVTISVAKAELSASTADTTIYQGNTMPTFEITYSGFVNNETESVLTTAPTATCNASANEVGTYSIVVSGGEADNYTFSYTHGTLTVIAKPDTTPIEIVKKMPIITWADTSFLTYGMVVDSTNMNATADIEGDFAYTISGKKIVVCEVIDTIIKIDTIYSTPYDVVQNVDTTTNDSVATTDSVIIVPIATNNKSIHIDTISSYNTTIIFDTTDFTAPLNIGDTLNAGEYTIIATFTPTDAINYITATDTACLLIEKALLEVSVANATISKGSKMPNFEIQYSGFEFDDNADSLIAAVVATTIETTDTIGKFDIILSAGISVNYNFDYMNGRLTITDDGTNVDEIEVVTIVAYPNPTNGIFVVETNSNIENIYIYSIQGRLLKVEPNVGTTQIDLTNYSQGTYIVKVGEKNIKLLKM